MLRKVDYWPFYFGVLIFGGLLVLPATFQYAISNGWIPRKDSYGMSIGLSLMYSSCFILALDRETCRIDLPKLLGYFVIINLLLLVKLFKDGESVFLGPGFLGLLIIYGAGWLGVKIGRALRMGEKIEAYNNNPNTINKRISGAIADSRAKARARHKEIRSRHPNRRPIDFETSAANDNASCPYCGGGLRTAKAKQCPHCLKSWRDEPPPSDPRH